MDKAELIRKLKHVAVSRDTEEAHIDADDLLLEYINDEDIKEAFENVPKWYA